MLSEKGRMRSGDMELEQSVDVDRMIDEFMAEVDSLSEQRHLQKGIARSQLPCSMVAILDREKLFILGQMQLNNRTASYFLRRELALSPQQAANSARWEFGFSDPFLIQFPARLLGQTSDERRAELQSIAASHIDSEFQRLQQLLSLLRTRPIFGQAGQPPAARTLLLLQPHGSGLKEIEEAIIDACRSSSLAVEQSPDISEGRSAVWEMWQSLNYAAVVVADLTGADPSVMYGLGIAHTLGVETVLIHPQSSKYLRDIPKTHSIEYVDSDAGRARLKEDLSRLLATL
jgi:hypothetical protein